jgi:hypothetical protein
MSTSAESAASAHEALGPVDVVVIGFSPDAPMTGDAIPLLMDLVDRGIVRVLDVLFVTKEADGGIAGFTATDLTSESVGDFAIFEGASSGLLGDEDAAKAGDAIEPGTSAVMIVYENRWAAPFAAAVRRNGGELVAHTRIPLEDLVAALDAAEAAS